MAGLYFVLTTSATNHPWAKYYASRGVSRPPLAELKRPAAAPAVQATKPAAAKPAELSPDLAAAVAAVTSNSTNTSVTSAPFMSVRQKEAVAREVSRVRRTRLVKVVSLAAAALVAVHFAVTRVFHRSPRETDVQLHAGRLPADVLPLYSTTQQPLQVDRVVVSEPERIDTNRVRYVAQVTLRLRKPLYAPAVTNGTVAYRQLQVGVQAARDQELRYDLFAGGDGPEAPELPQLIQAVHRAGESVVVKVPFYARRFGWQWKLEDPQLALRSANRTFEGHSVEYYAETPYLIFGGAETLAEIRQRTRLARDYVMAVAKEVQLHAEVEAVTEPVPAIATAEAVAEAKPDVEHKPAIDPNAPAVAELPAEALAPAVAAETASSAGPKLSVGRRR